MVHHERMARLYLLLFLVEIVAAACALISCLSTEEDEIRALPRLVWVLIILFFPLVGSIAWFVTGRSVPAGTAGPGPRLSSGGPDARRPSGAEPTVRRPRPIAPDDDPEFLRSIGRQDEADRELFTRWEADLRRREDEIRRREGGTAGPEGRDPSEPPREDNRPEV